MPIAVFYHCWLPSDFAVQILCEQVCALRSSGLEAAADEIIIGLNGDPTGSCVVQKVIPKAKIICHPENTLGEAATIRSLESWLPAHPGWSVCYHHLKGASHASDVYAGWRNCLTRHVIWNWRRCLFDMERGYETVGAHWTARLDQQYWAGTFWWASSDYLRKLTPIPDKTVEGKSYEAEVWIGKCGYRPRIKDYAHHQLMAGCR